MPYSYIGALDALSPENLFSKEGELELTPARLGVQTFWIALFTDAERGGHMDENKLTVYLHQAPHLYLWEAAGGSGRA